MKFLASPCVCGHQLNGEHEFSCPRGGFPTLCHNEACDITNSYLTEMLSNVTIESHFQPLSDEQLQWSSYNSDDSTRLDIAVDDFWSSSSRTFFDVRVYNPFAQLNSSTSDSAVYRRHKKC